MENCVKNFFHFHIISFSGFHSWFYHIHWFYLYRIFKHSNWWLCNRRSRLTALWRFINFVLLLLLLWRHKSSHTQII